MTVACTSELYIWYMDRLKCALIKVLCSIFFGVNFEGVGYSEFCSKLKGLPTYGSWDWTLQISRFLYQIPSLKNK